IICSFGVALHGLVLEAPSFTNMPCPELFDGLPEEFRANFLDEPAFDTRKSTFCIWRRVTDHHWSCGTPSELDVSDPDGSAQLLSILAGDPQQYVEFATE